MELNLKEKVVAITGGSSGIGLETALEFAREGALVAICGRNEAKLAQTKEVFSAEGFPVEVFSADVSKKNGIVGFVDFVVKRFGGLDVWVNNAGVGLSKSIDLFTDEEMDKLIDTNFKSAYWGCAAASACMKERGGVILNITSFGAKMPRVYGGMYSATKNAVESLTKSFAAELAPYKIRVISILPGLIETPMTEGRVATNREELTKCISLHRLGRPEHVAKPMVFLASEAAEYITGVSVEISGGKYAVQDPWKAWENIENT